MNPEVLHATALAISFDLKKRFAIRPAYGSAIALGNCEITLTSHIMLNSYKQNDWMSYTTVWYWEAVMKFIIDNHGQM